MKTRMISAPLLALVVGLAMLAPAPAFGQRTRLIIGTEHGIYIPAPDQQIVRVTLGNSQDPAASTDQRQAQSFVVQFDRPVDPVTIEPGKTFTYALYPSETGVLVDPTTGLRHVPVRFRVEVEVLEDTPAPQPSVTIEVLNRRTGKLDSFVAFPGFNGGVFVGG